MSLSDIGLHSPCGEIMSARTTCTKQSQVGCAKCCIPLAGKLCLQVMKNLKLNEFRLMVAFPLRGNYVCKGYLFQPLRSKALRYGHRRNTIFRQWAINFLLLRRPSNPYWAWHRRNQTKKCGFQRFAVLRGRRSCEVAKQPQYHF